MIHNFLCYGKQNAINSAHLCALLGFSKRDLAAMIEVERRSGIPICASTAAPAGYYLASSRQEMQAYCESLARRIKEIERTRLACVRSIDTLPDI